MKCWLHTNSVQEWNCPLWFGREKALGFYVVCDFVMVAEDSYSSIMFMMSCHLPKSKMYETKKESFFVCRWALYSYKAFQSLSTRIANEAIL
jgi:hypothetical protein